ncbi:hypothetical protein Tco_1553576 [Tanacetum coccineum]
MQPTFRGRLKRAYNQISYLETPTREVGLPYLICDYYEGSHEADECKQTNRADKSETPEPEAPTFAITTRSRISIRDPPFSAPPRPATDNFTKGETEKEGSKGAKPIVVPAPRPRLKKQKNDDEDERLLSIFKQIHINLPFLEAMIHMPKGAKVLKDLLLHKEKLKKATSLVKLSEECSAIIQRSLPLKEGDPGSFTLPCRIGPLVVKNALDDLGASINLMPHSLFRQLGISKLKHTKMSI